MIKRLCSVALGISTVAAALAAVSGCAHHAAPTNPAAAEAANPHLQRAWLADLALKDDRVESIHARADKLFVYTDTNQVYAISRFGGTIKWGAQVGEQFTSILPPLIAGDRVVFPCNTRLFIFDQNGILDHAQDVGFAMHAPGVTDGQNMVFIPAAREGSARMAAVDINKRVGEVIWEFFVRGPITAAPALYDNVLYVGCEDNRVYAVTTNRRPVWPLEGFGFSFETAGRIVADVKADDYAVYVASTDSKLYALDRMTGHIKWTYYGQAPLSTPPTPIGDNVYQYAPGQGLVSIDKNGAGSRQATWAAPDAVQVLSAGPKRLYVRLRDNTIGALDRQTGELLWRGTQKYAKFITNLQDTTIFVATPDGRIYAFQPTGEAPATRPAPQPKPATAPANAATHPNGMNHAAPAVQ